MSSVIGLEIHMYAAKKNNIPRRKNSLKETTGKKAKKIEFVAVAMAMFFVNLRHFSSTGYLVRGKSLLESWTTTFLPD